MTINTDLVVREVSESDFEQITSLHNEAFGGKDESGLVAALHARGDPLVSLVAQIGRRVVGHILFSPCRIEPKAEVSVWGLAPMAVLPDWQRQGIGGQLIRQGLAACRERGIQAVVVLGHTDYYPRFGFRPAGQFGLCSTYDVPPETFMAQELQAGALNGVSGTVHYDPLFSEL